MCTFPPSLLIRLSHPDDEGRLTASHEHQNTRANQPTDASRRSFQISRPAPGRTDRPLMTLRVQK